MTKMVQDSPVRSAGQSVAATFVPFVERQLRKVVSMGIGFNIGRRRSSGRYPVEVLDHIALLEKLAEYEDAYAIQSGERLSSAEFHDRYLAGRATGIPDAIEWASYYELLREHGRRALENTRTDHAIA
jgi:hypothetical protein